MAATRQLKQQVNELLTNDKSIIASIAEVVSSLIEKLSNSDEIFVKVATKMMNNSEFVKSVTSNLEGQTGSIKQELYESLSFDNHEIKDRLMKLEEYCGELKEKNKSMEWEIDSLEQYSRRNCLLIHGIPEPCESIVEEDTDALVINVLSQKLGLQVDKAHLDRSHRLGRRNPQSGTRSKPRPVIAKFVSYNTRSDVFRQKRKLKGTGMGITESLTKQRMVLYKAVSEHRNVSSAWSIDGRIIGLRRDNKNKVVIESPIDLRKL